MKNVFFSVLVVIIDMNYFFLVDIFKSPKKSGRKFIARQPTYTYVNLLLPLIYWAFGSI
jgi:hypothetical protein